MSLWTWRSRRRAGWGRKLPQGRGLGIAAHRSFVSYTAVVTEVAVGPKGELTIPRVDIAFDCGAVVNPDRVRSQLEGAVLFGLSHALYGEISMKAGVTEQTNPAGEEFGTVRLQEVVARNLNRSAAGIRDQIEAALSSFAQGTPAGDDITLLIVKRETGPK